MSINKRASEFIAPAQIEAMEAEIPRDATGAPTDDIEIATAGSGRAGATFDVKPQNTPSLANVYSTLGKSETDLKTDPRALENVSTAPCIASPVAYDENQLTDIQARSSIQATLENPKGMSAARIPLEVRRQLADIADAAKNLPTADTIAYVDNRKIYMAAEVRDVPNRLSKDQAIPVIEALVGEALTAKVINCANGNGFMEKPHLWLSQRLAYEASRHELLDQIKPIEGYDDAISADKEAIVPQAVTRVFSATVAHQLMVISRACHISMLQAIKILTERVVETATKEKAPKEYTKKYESMPELEQLMAAG